MLRRVPVFVRYEGRGATPKAQCEYVERLASRMLEALTLQAAELSILLCDDATMHALNFEHRGYDKPTDVLAFAQAEGELLRLPGNQVRALGDVVIALPTARRQAAEHGWPASIEICLLLAHGVLHLLGFDHATRTEERRMKARTDLLMAAGLADGRPVDKGRRLPPDSSATRRRGNAQDQ